ncbi:MAG: hypothetical protein IJ088_01930 [Clostridia bacterium]|nr:hypothetical protein [Clostridia bacterium]
MKFWMKLLLLWVILFAVAVIFSRHDRFTFVFEGEELSSFVIGEEQAEKDEEDAQSLKSAVQYQAAVRNYDGIYEGIGMLHIEDARRAVDENGLNLMWGTYDVNLKVYGTEALSCRIVCAGKQNFIRGGTAEDIPSEGSVTVSFTVTDAAEHIRLSVSDPQRVGAATIVKRGTTTIDRDLLAYLFVLGIMATIMLALGEGIGVSRNAGLSGLDCQAVLPTNQNAVCEEVKAICRERQQTAFLLIILTIFASAPLFWQGIYNGHDLMFHVNRIEGIAAALRQGQFPVRIHASTINGYGYAASEFYPELFLYFPAILRNLGVTLAAVLRIFVFTINAATAVSCYFSMKMLTGRRDTALGVTGLYMFSIYRLANLYTRATYGESLAMIFFPLLIAAMAEVLTGDVRKWPLLALSMVGIACSHLLSTLFSVILCAAAAFICLPKLVKEPKRMGAVLVAAVLTLVCCIGFFVPMFDYIKEGINTNVSLLPQRNTLSLGSYLIGFSGNKGEVAPEAEDYAYSIGVIPGLALMAGITLFLLLKFSKLKSDENRRLERICNVLMVFGTGLLLMATDITPWERISNMRKPFSAVAQQMQFPWRLVGVAVPMLSIPAALGYLKDDKWRKAGAVLMIVLGILPAAYTMQCKIEEEPLIYPDSYVTSYIGQSEYIYLFTDNEALWPGEIHLKGLDPREVTAYLKDGTNLTFTIRTTPGDHMIDLPLLYYPGYRAEGIGCDGVELVRGTNNVIQLNARNVREESSFRIWFEPPAAWTIASILSGIGFAVLMVIILIRRKALFNGTTNKD